MYRLKKNIDFSSYYFLEVINVYIYKICNIKRLYKILKNNSYLTQSCELFLFIFANIIFLCISSSSFKCFVWVVPISASWCYLRLLPFSYSVIKLLAFRKRGHSIASLMRSVWFASLSVILLYFCVIKFKCWFL